MAITVYVLYGIRKRQESEARRNQFWIGLYSLLQHHGWLKPYSVPLFRSPMDENQAAHILGAMELRHEGMFPGGCS